MSVNEWLTLGGVVLLVLIPFGGWMYRIDRLNTRVEVKLDGMKESYDKALAELTKEHQLLSTEIWNKISQHSDQIGGVKERVAILESQVGIRRKDNGDRLDFFGGGGS